MYDEEQDDDMKIFGLGSDIEKEVEGETQNKRTQKFDEKSKGMIKSKILSTSKIGKLVSIDI